MACDNGSCGDKDVKPCPVCGNAVPASLGFKPRKYCCARCRCVAKYKPRQSGPLECGECGICISQPLGKGRRRQFCDKCRLKRRSKPQKRAFQCESCGSPFESSYARRFCSKDCRHGDSSKGTKTQCKSCSASFIRRKKGQVYCSFECRLMHLPHPPTIYVCLCCEKPFKKKIYKSGAYSCQTKYCSRGCAFEARRRKLPAAQRPLEVAGRIAGWFLSWGDDVWPVITQCRACGCQLRATRQDECVRTACQACSAPPRRCAKCGCVASKYCQYCEPCAERSKSEAKKRAQKKRRWHQNIRKRCRRYGAPYTPVSRKKILDRDRWKCQICGVKLLAKYTKMLGTSSPHPRCPTVDHIIPLCLGKASPGHVESNLQAACWECNCLKSDKPLHSFVSQYTTSLD